MNYTNYVESTLSIPKYVDLLPSSKIFLVIKRNKLFLVCFTKDIEDEKERLTLTFSSVNSPMTSIIQRW